MPSVSNIALLAEIRALQKEFGRVPTKALMVGHGRFSPEIYEERFTSWEDMLVLAGFDPDNMERQRYQTIKQLDENRLNQIVVLLESNDTKEFFRGQLLAELHRLAIELDKTPSGPDMTAWGRYTTDAYNRYFGSWNEAIGWFDLVPNDEQLKISDEELFAELRRLAEEKGTRPSSVDMREQGKYTFPTYINRFGSWADACEQAGV